MCVDRCHCVSMREIGVDRCQCVRVLMRGLRVSMCVDSRCVYRSALMRERERERERERANRLHHVYV